MNTRQEIMEWRRSERKRLISERMAMPVAQRQEASGRIIDHLDSLCRSRGWLAPGSVVSAWWPLRREAAKRT